MGSILTSSLSRYGAISILSCSTSSRAIAMILASLSRADRYTGTPRSLRTCPRPAISTLLSAELFNKLNAIVASRICCLSSSVLLFLSLSSRNEIRRSLSASYFPNQLLMKLLTLAVLFLSVTYSYHVG